MAFTDCDRVVENPKVFSRCLTYAASLGALVVGHPQEPTLSSGAAATSGKFAALKGIPAVSSLAERMGLDRDISIVEMTGARYHADQLTTQRALTRLRRAKEAGHDVTAGVSIHHLTLNELDVGDYRTFFKVKPPLRSEDDRLATVEAVAKGLIDVISSMHTPQDEESKRLPFEEAASGAIGLETLLPAAMRLVHAGQIDLPTLWRAMSLNPAKAAGAIVGAPVNRSARRSGFVRSRCAFRDEPVHAAFEIQEHTLRRSKDARQGAGHLGRRPAHRDRGRSDHLNACQRRHPAYSAFDGRQAMPPIDTAVPFLLAIALAAYLLGGVPFGLVMAKVFGLPDPRGIGSGNIGATNVLRTGSKPAALATLILDSAKGLIAVLIARAIAGEDAAQLAGISAFLGHIFPVWLKFKGGKGVATFLGTLLGIAPFLGLAACAIWLAVFAVTRISSLSALMAAAFAPITAVFLGHPDASLVAHSRWHLSCSSRIGPISSVCAPGQSHASERQSDA